MESPAVRPMTSSSRSRDEVEKVTISFIDLSYSVKIKSSKCSSKNVADTKALLTSISGNMKPGLNAIMGPSGSGKSSLLNALSHRPKSGRVTGDIYFNGSRNLKDPRCILGYVSHVDCIMGTLTVKENLWFSANLRLNHTFSEEEKSCKVSEIISLLALEDCQDTKVGLDLFSGVSGGERKRTAIGMELIVRPSVLFLDEPTSGLDASTAHALMQLLKLLSTQGMNVVFSIHQPRFSIFNLFDTLLLLSEGKLIYHAPIQYTLTYFKSIGYECSPEDNPADFLLDVISGEFDIEAGNLPVVSDLLSREQYELHVNRLVEKFTTSPAVANLKYEIQQSIRLGLENRVKILKVTPKLNSFLILATLCGRSLKNLHRHPLALASSTIISLIIGIIFGLFYFQVDNSASDGVQNRLGFLFFVCSNMLFGSFAAIEIFVQEKDIFEHEYQSGHYKVWHYFVSKIFSDLLPMRTVGTFLFCSITYWMVGLKAEVEAFFTFSLTVFLLVYAATGIGIFYSATFKNVATSSIFVSLTFVCSILFDGFLVNTNTILPWLRWIKYLSISRYAFSSLCFNEFRHQQFLDCGLSFVANESVILNSTSLDFNEVEFSGTGSLDFNEVEFSGTGSCDWVTGEQILQGLSISDLNLTNWHVWENVITLGCIAFGLFLFSYIQLVRSMKK